MSLEPQIIDPTTYLGWDDLLLSTPGASFFHSSAWARVLSESYGYTPLYFTVFNNGKIQALVPLMEVRGIFAGKKGVSLPFTDFCQPIVDGDGSFKELLAHIISYGKKQGWRTLEFRGGQAFLHHCQEARFYLSHELDLREDEEEVFSRFRDSTKRSIRKAIKESVEVTISASEESLSHFYRLHAFTRRRHGLPPQPYSFFRNLYRFVLSEGKGWVALAHFRETPVAGAIYFHSGGKAYFKYGASDMKYQHLRANNLVMWNAIQWYCRNKFKSLNFGRTNPEEEGLIQFKSGWGTKEGRISYFRYDCGKEAFVTSSDAVYGFHNRVFRMMPMFLLKGVGSSLYRYVG